MNALDRRKNDLLAYNPSTTIEAEMLDRYWGEVLEQYSAKPLEVKREQVETMFPTVRAERLTYCGYDDTPIHCWLLLPQREQQRDPLPCIVTYPGYTLDKGQPERHAAWLQLGYAVLAVDVRGQGGETGSLLTQASGSVKGWVTQGITDIGSSYYLAVTMDAVRAVDAAAGQPEIDASRIAAVGGSQGGGLALLAAALNTKVSAVVADIPNMCNLDYGMLHSTGSLTELAAYVKRYPDQLNAVLDTLAYFDLLNLAERIAAPVLMSVGWKDTVCLPETVYAVFNRIRARKKINDYPFSGHEISEYQKSKAYEFIQTEFNFPRTSINA